MSTVAADTRASKACRGTRFTADERQATAERRALRLARRLGERLKKLAPSDPDSAGLRWCVEAYCLALESRLAPNV